MWCWRIDPPRRHRTAWVELDRLEHLEDGTSRDPGRRRHTRAGAGGVVLSSSGTTGTPKVVRLGQEKLLHTARRVASHLELGTEDRGFNPLPLFHINAEVVGLLSALVAGSSLVLDDRFHRSGFWDLMARRSITWINAVPAIVSRLGTLGPDETVPAPSGSSGRRRRRCRWPWPTGSRRAPGSRSLRPTA